MSNKPTKVSNQQATGCGLCINTIRTLANGAPCRKPTQDIQAHPWPWLPLPIACGKQFLRFVAHRPV